MQNALGGSRRPRLSVALVARDAAAMLEPTLASVASVADEVMVLDLGSNDGTAQRARELGAHVFSYPWADDYSAARNELWKRLTGDWVLWLDAGESMTEDGAARLDEFVHGAADPNRAYMMLIVVPAAAGEISGEQAGRIRLVPNRPDVRFTGRVRESVRAAVDAAGIQVDGIPWRIFRNPPADAAIKQAQARLDLRLLELEIADRGALPQLEVARGETYVALGDRTSAGAAFANALRMAPRGSTAQREAFYGILTCLDADGSQRRQQISTCLAALEIFPLDAQLLCAVGGYLQAEGRLDLAMRSYETACRHGEIDPESWHVPDIREIAAVCWNLTLQLREQDEAAFAVLEQALERMPESPRIRRHLIDLCIKHDRRQQALAHVDLLPGDQVHRLALRGAVRGACLAARQDWTEALGFLQAAHEAGCRDSICLRWLAIGLMATGQQTAAEEILHQWSAVDPRSSELQAYLAATGVTPVAPAPASSPSVSPATQPGRRLRLDPAAVAAGTAVLTSTPPPHCDQSSPSGSTAARPSQA